MSYTTTTPFNTPINIPVTSVIGATGSWTINSSYLRHNDNLGSYVYILEPDLIEGQTYRVTFKVTNYVSCQVKVLLGSTSGTLRSSNGTYVQDLVFHGIKKISFYATGLLDVSYYKIETLENIVTDTLLDITTMRNDSWTLSYNPILNQWISYHSYLPNNYLQHPSKFLAKTNSSQLKLGNSGDFGVYFEEDIKPFILETVFNEYPTETKVFDSVHFNLDSTNDEVFTNTFFDKSIVYTENQCSGEIVFDLTNLTKKEKNWNFNKFLDITNNLSQKVFVSDWDSVQTSYPIDKVINVDKINSSKPWYQRGRMRDKYLAVRFISSNVTNDKLYCKFVSTFFRASQR